MTKADELYYNRIDLSLARDEYEKELFLLSQSPVTEEVSIRMLKDCINRNLICKSRKIKRFNYVELKMLKGDLYLYFGDEDNLYQATRI